jgi:hypothetical protein
MVQGVFAPSIFVPPQGALGRGCRVYTLPGYIHPLHLPPTAISAPVWVAVLEVPPESAP